MDSASSRAGALGELYRRAGELAAAGDTEAARVLHEAAGRLLGAPRAGAPVVDLEAERRRRG
ncbi:MAG: hypothetical protein IT373_11910 [Polyangiaceae bacterium]|nr:hypothetical protein [Polyangiaceae bacterium]